MSNFNNVLDIYQDGYNLYKRTSNDKILKLKHKLYGYCLKKDISYFRTKSFKIDNNIYHDMFNREIRKVYINSFYGFDKELRDKLFGINLNYLYYKKEHNIEYSDNINDYRIWYWDIEVSIGKERDNNTPDNPKEPIITISWYDTINKQYYVIGWHKEETKNVQGYKYETKVTNDEKVTYIYVKDEYNLLKVFLSIMKKYKPIMLIGWFSNFFDSPYLIKRMEVNNFDTKLLSPLNTKIRYDKREYGGRSEWNINIPGLYSIELNKLVERYTGGKFASMALNNVSKELKLGQKIDIRFDTSYNNNFKKFMEYNINDVRLTKAIDNYYSITSFMIYVHNLTDIPFDNIMSSSLIVRNAIIKTSNEIVISKKQSFNNYQGAIVLEPKFQGVLKNLATLDANSMYPTSMITFNISPDTFICSYNDITENKDNIKEFIENKLSVVVNKKLKLPKLDDIDIITYVKQLLKFNNIDYIDTGYSDELIGKGYLFMHHNYKVGIYTKYLKSVYDKRKAVKKEMKKHKKNTVEYHQLDALNMALKLELNTTYGANGYSSFFLYDPKIADSVTYFARKLLTYAIDYIKQYKYETQYGDTDSLFILLHNKEDDLDKCLEEGEQLNKKVNDNIPKLHTNKYISTSLPEMYDKYLGFKLEHILHYIYFSDSKKRYFGIEYPDENGKEEPYVRGMNVIRKDTPEIMKKILKDLIYKILKGNITKKDFSDIKEELQNTSLEKIGIVKSFNKNFNNYKVLPQHVRAALFAKEKYNIHINNFDKPFMFYVKIKNTMKKYKYYNGVIALNQKDLHLLREDPDIEINYDQFIEKQIIEPFKEFKYVKELDSILNVLRYKNKHSQYISLFDF